MKQISFADAEYAGKRKQSRRERYLIEMDQVVPWEGLITLIEAHETKGEGGRPPYPLMAILRVRLMQNGFGYSDSAMEESLYEATILRHFAGLSLKRIPDETTILNFRRLLEKHDLAAGILSVINDDLGDRGLLLHHGTIVDASIIHAPSSTKNKEGKRDSEMHQTKKGNHYYFGMKAHIGMDADSSLEHSVLGTAANVAVVTQVDRLLHGEETHTAGDAGYTSVHKRPEHEGRIMIGSISARPNSYKKHGKKSLIGRVKRKIEYTKRRFRGLVKNTAQQVTLFALSNLWMARKQLMIAGEVRP
ncbi:IS5 family transposase [Pseudomonas paeninsulae]|uniref:IS5 family transposase n=1 Tax=Pseudomonas paeninsulae TaxID=3110772 RepID=UPI002D766BBC|nr:IS5 family transposase [Pseudomonas sp. IT1137]